MDIRLIGKNNGNCQNINQQTAYTYTRLGVSGAFFLGLRAEVNPGEFLDFVLGFFGLDIYDDDAHLRKNKKNSLSLITSVGHGESK